MKRKKIRIYQIGNLCFFELFGIWSHPAYPGFPESSRTIDPDAAEIKLRPEDQQGKEERE